MSIIIAVITFLICNVVIFWYVRKGFTIISINKRLCGVALAFNGIIISLYTNYIEYINDSIITLVCLAVLFVEFRLLFKGELLANFFAAVFVTIWLSSIKMIVGSICARLDNEYIHVYLSDRENLIEINIIAFIVLAGLVLILSRIISMKAIVAAISYRESMNFVIGALTTMYVYIIAVEDIVYLKGNDFGITNFNLQNGIGTLFTSSVIVLYSYVYSQLQMFEHKEKFMKSQIESMSEKIEMLEANLDFDKETKLFTRAFAEKKIKENIENKNNFTVLFFDVDGLKFVNDTFGHNEGDFYINTVAEIIQKGIPEGNLSRFGGDEFVAIIDNEKGYNINQMAIICCENVSSIKEIFDKEYLTSVSYGQVDVLGTRSYTVEEIMELADKRMYEHKKARKKSRK